MNKYILSISILLLASQNHGQGLIFNKDAFLEGKSIEKTRADVIYSKASLKMYAPYVLTQNKSNCVAYSISNARTILLAKQIGISNKDTITALMFSPHWIYYRNKEQDDFDCMMDIPEHIDPPNPENKIA